MVKEGNPQDEYNKLIREYFFRGMCGKRLDEYRIRLKAFFNDPDNRAAFYEDFLETGVGESFYMAYGFQILS